MEVNSQRPPMPAGVVLAVVALGLFVLLQLIFFVISPREVMQGLIQLVLAVLFLVFLILGHPLARQWAYLVSVLFLIGALVGFFELFNRPFPLSQASPLQVGICLILVSIPILIMVGISLKRSRIFFDLQCPKCKSFKVKAASFLYNRIKCTECKEQWRLRQHKVEVEAFD